MRLSNAPKYFLFGAFLLISTAACGSSGNGSNSPPASIPEPPRSIPFATKEPDVYSAGLVVITGGSERKFAIVRDNTRLRIDFEVGTPAHRVFIRTSELYLVDPLNKRFADISGADDPYFGPEFVMDLANQLLTAKIYSDFEEIGTRDGLLVFRTVLNGSTTSEVLVLFDKLLGMPVRQEFYSVEAENRTMMYAVELRDFSTSIDAAAFEIPKDFRRVSRRELEQ